MRPRKVVLCVDADESALAIRRFLLDSKGYRVLSALDHESGLELAKMYRPAVAVIACDLGSTDGNQLVKKIKALGADVKTILFSEILPVGSRAHDADAFLGKKCNSPVDLVELVVVMSARKRGPKKVAREMVG